MQTFSEVAALPNALTGDRFQVEFTLTDPKRNVIFPTAKEFWSDAETFNEKDSVADILEEKTIVIIFLETVDLIQRKLIRANREPEAIVFKLFDPTGQIVETKTFFGCKLQIIDYDPYSTHNFDARVFTALYKYKSYSIV